MSISMNSEESQKHQSIREDYGSLYDATEELFFNRDPIGLNFGDNQDEYAPEVAAVLPHLSNCSSAADVTILVHEVFIRFFTEEMAGMRKQYEMIGEDLWRMWREIKENGINQS